MKTWYLYSVINNDKHFSKKCESKEQAKKLAYKYLSKHKICLDHLHKCNIGYCDMAKGISIYIIEYSYKNNVTTAADVELR